MKFDIIPGMDFLMEKPHKKLFQGILSFISLILLISAFQFGLINQAISSTADCPFEPGHSAMCTDTPLEHIQEWQSFFTVLPTKEIFSLILVVSLSFVLFKAAKVFLQSYLLKTRHLFGYCCLNLVIQDPLKEAYSSGILNTKTF